MIENINELIDSNLNLICQTTKKQIFAHKLIDINEKELTQKFKSELFADEMESRGLIRRINELCIVSEFGFDIFKNGGWLNYLEKKKKDEDELEQNKSAKDQLELEIKLLTKDKLEHLKKIRNQEDRIRNLEEQIKFISLIKLYWWLIPICIAVGIGLAKIWNLFF